MAEFWIIIDGTRIKAEVAASVTASRLSTNSELICWDLTGAPSAVLRWLAAQLDLQAQALRLAALQAEQLEL